MDRAVMERRLRECDTFFRLPQVAASASPRREAMAALNRTGIHWSVNSEMVACDFSDTDRYNKLAEVGELLGLHMGSSRTLWRDDALVELNHAVLRGYSTARRRVADHRHSADTSCGHVDRDTDAGHRRAADWSQINSPMSARLTPALYGFFDPVDEDLRPKAGPGRVELPLVAGLAARPGVDAAHAGDGSAVDRAQQGVESITAHAKSVVGRHSSRPCPVSAAAGSDVLLSARDGHSSPAAGSIGAHAWLGGAW